MALTGRMNSACYVTDSGSVRERVFVCPVDASTMVRIKSVINQRNESGRRVPGKGVKQDRRGAMETREHLWPP